MDFLVDSVEQLDSTPSEAAISRPFIYLPRVQTITKFGRFFILAQRYLVPIIEIGSTRIAPQKKRETWTGQVCRGATIVYAFLIYIYLSRCPKSRARTSILSMIDNSYQAHRLNTSSVPRTSGLLRPRQECPTQVVFVLRWYPHPQQYLFPITKSNKLQACYDQLHSSKLHLHLLLVCNLERD